MKIIYQKKFRKRFEKLDARFQQRVIGAIEVFQRNPLDSKLKNHTLKGKMLGLRAFSVSGIDVGTHNQVY